MRPLLLAIGGAIYIGGFLALIYVVGIAKPSLESWAPIQAVMNWPTASPFDAPRGANDVAAGMPTPRPAPDARASGSSWSAPPDTAASKIPRAAFSPCPKPIPVQPSVKVAPAAVKAPAGLVKVAPPAAKPATGLVKAAPPAAKPATGFIAPLTRKTAPPARIVHERGVEHSVDSKPQAKDAVAPPVSREEPRASSVLVPIGKSAAVGVTNDLDPRAAPHGALLINPPAAATPQAASAGTQSQ